MTKLNNLRSVGLLLIRVVLGLIFIAHGYPKLFNSAPFMDFFVSKGFPAWTVYLAGGVELFGGALLIGGLFNRYAAFLLSGHMAVTFAVVHWKLGAGGVFKFLGNSGDEYPLLLSVACFLLATTGAGKLSLDWVIFRDKA